jgi:histidyl-tRNA synthetase
LIKFKIPCQWNCYLARGLDYYTGLVFEIDLETEKAILGGGRYDQLYKELGNLDFPAIGFAIGIERLIEYLEESQLLRIKNQVDIFFLANQSKDYLDILS